VLNKCALVFALGVLISGSVTAKEIVLDKDKLEAEYIECIELNFKGGCFSKVFSEYFDRGASESEKVLADTEGFYIRWMSEHSVYKVHAAGKVLRAGVFDNRSYLIERSDGQLSGILIGFRKIKGNWYVYDIQGGNTDSFIRGLLDMPRIITKD
jgi:hypothetical protein